MKNVFLLPTDKPSRLSKDENDRIWLSINFEYGINDYNKHRLERLAKFKDGTNRHKDYGLDGLALDLNNIYHGLQAKYYLTNKVSAIIFAVIVFPTPVGPA